MNPRLVEPGFVVACLHADSPARPGKDESGDDGEAQRARRHGKGHDIERPGPCASEASGSAPCGKDVSSMFMRVNSKCADQVRPPPGPWKGWTQGLKLWLPLRAGEVGVRGALRGVESVRHTGGREKVGGSAAAPLARGSAF